MDTEPKTFIAALEEIKRLKAKNVALNEECDKAKNYMLTLGRDINEKAKEIAELKAVTERLSGDYFTTQIEGEEEWQFLDRELTATKQFAADALERIKQDID